MASGVLSGRIGAGRLYPLHQVPGGLRSEVRQQVLAAQHLGDVMRARTWSASFACAATLLVLSPTAAHADPPDTPAGTGGGCRENGQEVAGNARELRPFGATVVSGNAPIAPLNAVFFKMFCGSTD